MKWSWPSKFKPPGQWVMGFLIVLLIADLVLLAFLARNPLCLESSLLQRLDWVSSDGKKATIYSCRTKIATPQEKIFVQRLDEIQKRITQFESLLKTNFVPIRPIKAVVQEGSSLTLQISSDSVVIGEGLFFKKSLSFERAYLKAWLQQFQKGPGLGFLRLDVMTHFLMWNLGVHQHYESHWQTLLAQWPQLASTWSGYCNSPIKDESYTALCLSPSFTKAAESFMPLSMSFWMSLKLWQAFQLQSVGEQIDFFKSIGRFIEVLSETPDTPLSDMTLAEMETLGRTESEVWKRTLERVGFKDWAWSFDLKIIGALDSYKTSLGRVDLHLKKNGAWTASELQDYQQLSFQEANYRIMAENSEGLWSFPWLAPIKLTAVPSVRTQNLVWISCAWPTVKELLDMQERADKVLVVQECGENPKPLILSGFLHRGLQFFSLDNKDIKFILVNIEALRFLIKRDDAFRDKKLGAFEQVNERKNELAARANWSSVLWNQKYRAYEVQATVDVVEWFKLPENTWPDFE